MYEKLVYDNEQYCINARDQINTNMGYTPPDNNFDDPMEINNPEHDLYQKWYIAMPGGDEEHHELWMTNVPEKSAEHPEGYMVHEWEATWRIPEGPIYP